MSLIMPKGDGTLKALNSSIKIYYENKDKQWLFNDKFKKLISKEMGFEFLKNGEPARDGPFLIKKSEIARYFGLIEYIFGKKGKITNTGIKYSRGISSSSDHSAFDQRGGPGAAHAHWRSRSSAGSARRGRRALAGGGGAGKGASGG